jgi:hypothetical protein
MARFFGEIGYGAQIESAPGVWKDGIVEKSYYGDVIRPSKQSQEGQSVNKDITVGNSISIVADEYAGEHFLAIRYIRWLGVLWTVANVDVQHPRLVLRLGAKYNGPVGTPV